MDDASESSPLIGGMVNFHKISYLIAIFDMAQSIYFMTQSATMLILEINLFSILSCVGSIFWFLTSLLLLVGLCKDRHRLIACWLLFSVLGILADISFFVWTIISSEYVEFNTILHFSIFYLGIVVEWICIYVIYKYHFKSIRIFEHHEENAQENEIYLYEFEHPSERRQSLRPREEPVPAPGPPKEIEKQPSGKPTRHRYSLLMAEYRRKKKGGST